VTGLTVPLLVSRLLGADDPVPPFFFFFSVKVNGWPPFFSLRTAQAFFFSSR